MPFLLLIFSNLLRQRIRTFLTVLGISIGITTVVALGVITHSVASSTSDLLHAGGSDFSIGRAGSADLSFSTLTQEDLDTVTAYPEIEHVMGVLMAFARVGSNPFFVELGIDAEDLAYFDTPLVEGRKIAPGVTDEVMLGDQASRQLGAGAGETVSIRDRPYDVVGVYDTGAVYIDGGAVLPIQAVWEQENKEGLFTLLYVKVKPGTDVQRLANQIEEDHPELATLVDIGDIGDVDQGLEILDAVNLGITVLAVFIGGIAVMNTMVMAVFERTREFGILRALGWRTRRILQMVLGEALLLCMIAAAFGSLLAFILTKLIVQLPAIQAFISPEYTWDVFARGLAVGVGVALLGALYPAYRAASFSPAQAIRYE
jgi:putative ABC transport system permease protein